MKGNFKTIILGVFILAAVLGLLAFSGKIKIGKDTNTAGSLGTVILWGTARSSAISDALEKFNADNPTFILKYVQKYPDTYNQDLLNALASGVGPDMFFLPDNLAFSYKNRITPILYSTYSLASYKNNFISAGDVFLSSAGIFAFPITVDPMVMYYNRGMLDTNSIISPPTYWDEFAKLVPSLTKRDESQKIIKSTVSLGQFSNVTHAKDILATLFMQSGNQVVVEKEGSFVPVLNDYIPGKKLSLDTVLDFYTDFTDPLKDVYTWNKSLPESRDDFTADNLAFYFGYASELQSLTNANPNLNFLVSPMPQLRGANFKLTSARVTGIAVSAFSKNPTTAFTAAGLLSTSDFASQYAAATGTIPVRRDLLTSAKPTDTFTPIFYSSALYSKSWLDPSPSGSDNVFRKMIDNILSNNMTSQDAIRDANSKLSFLLIN